MVWPEGLCELLLPRLRKAWRLSSLWMMLCTADLALDDS